MSVSTISLPSGDFTSWGLSLHQRIHYQLSPGELEAYSIVRGEGILTDSGALAIRTGEFTGRSPNDRFIVRDELTDPTINWNDGFNHPIESRYFDLIFREIIRYFNGLPEYWIRDAYACADEAFRLNIRVINEDASANLFAYNMFLRPGQEELPEFMPDWHIFCAPALQLDPVVYGVRHRHAVTISFRHRMILIAGTGYTGEIKKSIFTALNFLLPRENVLSMHCSANIGERGDTALFFGLSGTGKTTLSADPSRRLIGDDEHGWSDERIFNMEGGCYAKTIDLDNQKEPDIFQAIRKGALLENVDFFPGTRAVNFSGRSVTENTRVSYPLYYIPNACDPAIGSIPENIFFLTCDAYGVLPPLSVLNPEQAMYQFISGYTAKVAGTEEGVKEPVSTFSACFGAPFMPLHPGKYARMLGERLRKYKVKCWLVNTGWSGGAYGRGSRISLPYTRAMIAAALEGKLDAASYRKDPVFGLMIPNHCPGVPSSLLYPRNTWADEEAYDQTAKGLAAQFKANLTKYAAELDPAILDAGPIV
ncbi:MAG: phosphoenolpyruvate carboxykinase (ATP) [Chitinophagaceae bacterium]|nr:phosphoenolpyruvate carboxykinase (ATP) [Chitinophagaceae bacterium]